MTSLYNCESIGRLKLSLQFFKTLVSFYLFMWKIRAVSVRMEFSWKEFSRQWQIFSLLIFVTMVISKEWYF